MEEFKDNEMIVNEWVRSDTGEVFSSYDDLVASRENYHDEDNNQFDFLFNNGNIRYFIKDNIVWFIGKDICDYLEYERARDAIHDHVSPANVMHFSYGNICKELAENIKSGESPLLESEPIGPRGALCITEQGVYELCRFSRMPKANDFYEWIHNRVLPNIRQTGTYMTPNAMDELYRNPEKVREIVDENIRITKELEEAHRRISTTERILKVTQENVDFNNASISDLRKIIEASDSEAKRIADQATFEAQVYKREKDIAYDKVSSLESSLSKSDQRISYLESKLTENNIAYSNKQPKVEMCRVVKPMDDIDTILSRLIKK